MTKSFYTNVQVYGNHILYIGVENGRKVRHKLEYSPTVFINSPKPSEYKTVSGTYVAPIIMGGIRETKEYIKTKENIDNFTVYGNQRFEYTYIYENFPQEINWDRSYINVCNIDIEVGSENGFPSPETATEPITAITYKMNDKFIVYGCGDFVNKFKNVRYIKCFDEIDLIKRFVDDWTGNYPDIITGWNVKFFDIPYLVNRIKNKMGEDFVKRLSPWNILRDRNVLIMGKQQTTYVPLGIAVLDYIDLYKKYVPGGASQESYKLDAICHNDLGERKLSYEEYGNLHTLYKDNYQLFIEYNIKDVELVEKLDNKHKVIDLVLTLCYDNKCNYEDVFSQVRMWDVIITNRLMDTKVVVPPNKPREKSQAYVGAYVKDPLLGMHNWIASFDLNSLYPHLIMQYNVSPDTIVEPEKYTFDQSKIIDQNINVDNMLTKKIDTSALKLCDCTITPNGQLFTTKYQGFLPKIMEEMYNDRSRYKKEAIKAKKQLETETDSNVREEIEKTIARYNNLQLAKKVSLNSAYGALGNEFFRFFDIRQASAITTAGQLSIRWIENKLNEYLNRILKTEKKDYVIASDTDSIYLVLDELVSQTIGKENKNHNTKQVIQFLDKVCESKIQPFIDKAYSELAGYTNAYSQKMIMKREALADKGIWTAKKRYVLRVHNNEGVEYKTPQVKVMGLEVVKSSTPNFCRLKLKDALDVILSKTEEEMIEFIEKVRNEFKTLPLGDIAFPRGVNGLSKYYDEKKGLIQKGTPVHVRGSFNYNNLIKKHNLQKKYPFVMEGEKIKFIYLAEPNPIQSHIISFHQVLPDEFGLTKYVDYDIQFEKSFLEPLKTILDLIEWKTEKINTLEDFFS